MKHTTLFQTIIKKGVALTLIATYALTPVASIYATEITPVYDTQSTDIAESTDIATEDLEIGEAITIDISSDELEEELAPAFLAVAEQSMTSRAFNPLSFLSFLASLTSSSTSTSSQSFEEQVVTLVNKERKKVGLSALILDTKLQDVARIKSDDMRTNKYFSHTSPTYGSPFAMLKHFGISYSMAAENIARGQSTPAEVVASWMNSSGHRENILNKNYTHIGVGYSANGHYWTQLFIKK